MSVALGIFMCPSHFEFPFSPMQFSISFLFFLSYLLPLLFSLFMIKSEYWQCCSTTLLPLWNTNILWPPHNPKSRKGKLPAVSFRPSGFHHGWTNHKAELCHPASQLSGTNRPDSSEESRQADGGGGAETEVITEASQILAVKRVAEPNISFHEPKR